VAVIISVSRLLNLAELRLLEQIGEENLYLRVPEAIEDVGEFSVRKEDGSEIRDA
jgi:hypothetical protein